MDLILTDLIVSRIREDVYNLLDIQGDLSNDYHHIRHVENYAIELCEKRHLNINIGIAIALMHDLGRIIGGFYGKEHASIGSQIAKEWLKKLDVVDETSHVITMAIRNHNQKQCIEHDDFSELIKDADSLAHKDEFQDGLPKYEKIRAEIARFSPMRIDFKSLDQAILIFNKQITEIVRILDTEDDSLITDIFVHDLRIAIRTIGAILTLVTTDESEKYNQLQKVLKKVFKLLEDSRKLTVFKKSLKKTGLSKSDYRFLKDLIEEENANILHGFHKIRNKYEAVLHDSYDSILNKDDVLHIFKKNLSNYKNTIQMVQLDEMESLHQLRIYGKNFKYLIDNNVLTIGESFDLELINDLHMAIGRLHDIVENQKILSNYIKTNRINLNHKQELMITDFYESRMVKEHKEIKRLIFMFKKRQGTSHTL